MSKFKDIYVSGNFDLIEEKYGIIFNDKDLLVKAFVHPSLFAEKNENYQRLEFLGDSVLQMVVSDWMYITRPEQKEGQMSKERAILVSEFSLAYLIKQEGLEKYLQLGKSILKDNVELSNSYVSDVYESFVAAIYLDQGYNEAKRFIENTLIANVDSLMNQDVAKDYKTNLQEELQVNGTINIRYETKKLEDEFESRVFLENVEIGCGKGKTKKAAEQQAAKHALSCRVG